MVETTTRHPIQTDTWVKATWDEFVATAYSPPLPRRTGLLRP